MGTKIYNSGSDAAAAEAAKIRAWRKQDQRCHVINTIPHALTGYQMAWLLQHLWKRHNTDAAALLIHRGQSASVMNSIRVACSRERERNNELRVFELRFSDPIPVRMPLGKLDIALDAEYIIAARVAGGKQTRFAAAVNQVMDTIGNIE